MNREEHRTYIKRELFELFKETVVTFNHLGRGMEFFAISNHLLNSLFLQMTGAQEQKMKCICWELATDDLRYRYNRYYDGWKLNQCSRLSDKAQVYEDLMSAIKKKDVCYKLFVNDTEKIAFRDDLYLQIVDILNNTNIAYLYKRDYDTFKDIFPQISPQNITPSDKLIFKNGNKNFPIENASTDTELFAIYSLLYDYRNKCAHNTSSYQLNLPHLKMLRNSEYQKRNNIFLFLATLLMIDELFIKLFGKYETLDTF